MELRYCDQCGNVIRIEGTVPLEGAPSFVCDRCKQGGPKSAPVPGKKEAQGASMRSDNLNFFSTKTIALHKQRNDSTKPGDGRPKSSRLRLVKGGSGSVPASGQAPAATSRLSTAGPGASPGGSPPAQRLLFGCLHCRAPLSIRPVEKTSKLTCPHCSNVIYVTASGQISKSLRLSKTPGPAAAASLPMVGSVRVRESATVTAEESAPEISRPGAGGKGSVRLLREAPRSGSSAVRATAAREARTVSEDTEKTDFIAAEKTRGLRAPRPAAPSARVEAVGMAQASPRPPASTERLPCDESDLLGEALEVASSLGAPDERSSREQESAAGGAPASAPEGTKVGLTKRVIKAIFQP